MALSPLLAAAGFLVGLLVGLSGVGAGSVLTPALMLLGVPPVVAVGSDFLCNLLTKVVGAVRYSWQRCIDYRWVLYLGLGSLPGTVAGALILQWLHRQHGGGADAMLRTVLGVVLAALAAAGIAREVRRWLSRRRPGAGGASGGVSGSVSGDASGGASGGTAHECPATGAGPAGRAGPAPLPRRWVLPLVGAGVGLVVGFTSVGAGALVALVLLAHSGLEPRRVVGTDIAHAVLVTAAGAAMHWRAGTVDVMLVANVLLGSVPGVLLGSRLATWTPASVLRVVVHSLVLAGGVALV